MPCSANVSSRMSVISLDRWALMPETFRQREAISERNTSIWMLMLLDNSSPGVLIRPKICRLTSSTAARRRPIAAM